MVNAPDTSSALKTLFTGQPEMLIQYILSQGRLAVILLDQQGTIVDCNPFFLESMAINEKPVGQSIDTFLREGFPVCRDLTPGDCLPVKLTFAWNDAIEHSLAGHVLKHNGHYIIFAHSVRLTDHKLAAALSRLTDELTDLTRELNKKNRELEAANVTITRLMNTDPLTGLTNRRQLTEKLDAEMSKAKRHNHPLSALMTDIDHFKSINDTYGHDAGDKVLMQVAQTLLTTCRKEDIVARYGGEEFVVILPNSPATSALECAERIRKAIEETVCPGVDRRMTVSVGATLFAADDTEESLIKRADTALYDAKESGRNRVALK
jgi:diguanylate cyclase (GGDEF)-like protein